MSAEPLFGYSQPFRRQKKKLYVLAMFSLHTMPVLSIHYLTEARENKGVSTTVSLRYLYPVIPHVVYAAATNDITCDTPALP